MRFMVVIVFMLTLGCVEALEYTFRVLINKGQNSIRSGSEWLPIKVGTSLKSADELRISQNGYLGLVHFSGKPLEVKEPGKHKVQNLASRIKPGLSVLHKYTDFILSTHEKRNNLTASGAVHRGSNEIKVFLPEAEQAVVFNANISIAWAKDAKTPVYVIRFNNMFGDELDRLEVKDTTLSVDLNSTKFMNEDNILIEVASKIDSKKKSEQFMIKKVSAADKARINTALKEMGDLTAEENALNHLYLANFYEKHSLLIDASTSYQKAIQLAADVPYFQQAYRAFLLRSGMIKTR